MAVTSRTLRSTGSGALLFVLALASLRALPEPVEAPVAEAEVLMETLAQIASGEAEEEAEDVAKEAFLVPMGTPCLMRRPRLAEGVDRSWRHVFAAATLTADPVRRAEILADLATKAPNELTGWRMDIAQAEAALRIGDQPGAEVHLARAATRDVPESCRADVDYYTAASQDTPQAKVLLLVRAVAADPGFWDAQEDLAVLSMIGTGNDPASCEADAVRTLETVVQLAALARRDTQFQRLNRALEALPINGRTALMRGMILRQTGEAEAAIDAYTAGLGALGSSACDATLRSALEGMISATEARL